MRVKGPTFHFHVTQEVKAENELEFVDLKLKYAFVSFSFNCFLKFQIICLCMYKR